MKYVLIEHSRLGYWFDFAAYGFLLLLSPAFLGYFVPKVEWTRLLLLFVSGTACWTLLEYAIHRFVLHGIRPFSEWHAEHHGRPTAFIGAPVWLTAALFIVLIFLPILAWSDVQHALAITLGLAAGYLAYSLVHHATHHWRARGPWMSERKRWHALHHHACGARHYGVTTSFWDQIFRTCTKRSIEP